MVLVRDRSPEGKAPVPITSPTTSKGSIDAIETVIAHNKHTDKGNLQPVTCGLLGDCRAQTIHVAPVSAHNEHSSAAMFFEKRTNLKNLSFDILDKYL
jgi:hypothetical protein